MGGTHGQVVTPARTSPTPVAKLPATVLGIPIDDCTLESVVERVGTMIADGRRSGRTHQIATVNVDFVVNAVEDPDLRHILQQTDLNVCDGMPLVWAARTSGMPMGERVAGADLVPAIAAAAAEHGWHVHLFGGAPGVVERAQTKMVERHPKLIVTADAGPSIPDPTSVPDEIIERIARHDADILCVALGNPKQERFIATYRERLRAPVQIGVGGTFDLYTGLKRRAPTWAQRAGLEWVFRAVQEPRRLGPRYAKDLAVFAPRVLRTAPEIRCRSARSDLRVAVHDDESGVVATYDSESESSLDAVLGSIPGSSLVEIDVSCARSISPRVHALLIQVLRLAQLHDVPVVDLGLSSSARRSLAARDTLCWYESAVLGRAHPQLAAEWSGPESPN